MNRRGSRFIIPPLVFVVVNMAGGCGVETNTGSTESSDDSGGSGRDSNDSGGANSSGGAAESGGAGGSGGSVASGGSPTTSGTNCEAVYRLGNGRAAARGCKPESNTGYCESIYRANRCVTEWEALWDCAETQPDSFWICDEVGEIAIGDTACRDELAAFRAAVGTTVGCR